MGGLTWPRVACVAGVSGICTTESTGHSHHNICLHSLPICGTGDLEKTAALRLIIAPMICDEAIMDQLVGLSSKSIVVLQFSSKSIGAYSDLAGLAGTSTPAGGVRIVLCIT